MAADAPDLNPLDTSAVEALVDQALAGFEAASTLEELREVRQSVLGDAAPLVAANRTIGSLDPSDRGAAGRNLGGARQRIQAALGAREEVLAAAHEAQVLVEEALDVTVPTRRAPAGARHPLETLMEEVGDFFVAMGW